MPEIRPDAAVLARLMLVRMARRTKAVHAITARRTVLFLLIVAALSVAAMARPVVVDVAFGPGHGHALLGLGFASVRIVFETGQDCPKSDGCNGILR